MGFTEDYMMKLNNYNYVTVLKGKGKFYEYHSGETYDIHSIKLPFTSSGKHITVVSKDDPDVLEYREYFEGKIVSFESNKVYHWELN